MVGGLELGRWDVADRLEEPAVVEPVDPLQGGVLDVVDALPGAAPADQLGLVKPDDRLGERVVVGVATGTDRGGHAGLGKALGVADRQVLGGFNWSSQHLDGEELRWEHGDRGRAWRAGYRCAHLVGRRWRGVGIGNGSGTRSRTGGPAGTPPRRVAYRAW